MIKRIFLMVLALLTLVGVAAFGFEQAGPLGSMAAIGLSTSAVAYFFGAKPVEGLLFANIGHMRPLRRSESNLGGIVKLSIYTEIQFTSGARWPTRGKLALTGAIPLITTPAETAAVFTFDIGTCKGDFQSSGAITNITYKHSIEFTVTGFSQEQLDTLDDLYNMGIVAIATYQNGQQVVYGSSNLPLVATVTGSTGSSSEDDRNFTVKFEQIKGCDFAPRKVGSGVTITEAVVPAYPALVNNITP